MIIIKTINKFLMGIIFLFFYLLFPSIKSYSNKPANVLPITKIYSSLFDVKEVNKECSYEYVNKLRIDDGYIIYLYNSDVISNVNGVCVYKNSNELWIMDYDSIIHKYKMLDNVYIRLYQYVYPNDLIARASNNGLYYYFVDEN